MAVYDFGVQQNLKLVGRYSMGMQAALVYAASCFLLSMATAVLRRRHLASAGLFGHAMRTILEANRFSRILMHLRYYGKVAPSHLLILESC
jgi:hypothetical protein